MSDIVFNPLLRQWQLKPEARLAWTQPSSSLSAAERIAHLANIYKAVQKIVNSTPSAALPVGSHAASSGDHDVTGIMSHGAVRGSGTYGSTLKGSKKKREDVSALAQNLQRQANGVKGSVPESSKPHGKSFLSRGLDIISRPAYASAAFFKVGAHPLHKGGGIKQVLPHPNLDNPIHPTHPVSRKTLVRPSVSAAIKGFEGKDKSSFADVMAKQGFEKLPSGVGVPTKGGGILDNLRALTGNPFNRAANSGQDASAFALDVGLDPSTYLTLGTETSARSLLKSGGESLAKKELTAKVADVVAKGGSRKAGERVAEAAVHSGDRLAAEKAVKDVVERAKVEEPIFQKATRDKVARDARNVFEKEANAEGRAITKNEVNEAGRKAVADREEATLKAVTDRALDEKATREALSKSRKLVLKAAGEPIFESEKLGNALGKTGEAMRSTKIGDWGNRAFRTNAEVGGRLHELQRRFLNSSSAAFEEKMKEIRTVFKDAGTNRKERELVTSALEAGSPKGLNSRLQNVYEYAQRVFKEVADNELEVGAIKPEALQQNYIYHVYKNKEFARGIGTELGPRGYGVAKKFDTLEAAKAAGANPITDIADILAHRVAKSHRIIAQHSLAQDVSLKFGVQIGGKKAADRVLKGMVDNKTLIEGNKLKGFGSLMPKGVYFDRDTADALTKMNKIFSSDRTIGEFTRTFDKIQAQTKFLMIGPNPGAQIRNLQGDVLVNMLDGVTDPGIYSKAVDLISGNLDAVHIRVGEKYLDGADVMRLYEGMGLKTGFFHAETDVLPKGRFGVLGKVGDTIRQASENREDFTRIAHFMDAMKKEAPLGGDLNEIAERAAKRVKKYNFDYQDLTDIERRFFRRAVPFYTYLRKNLPLMVESYFTRPGRLAVVPKGLNALQRMVGQKQDETDAFPGFVDAVPDWLRATNPVQLRAQGPDSDALFLQPDLPTNQVQDYFGGFTEGQGVGGHATAGAKNILGQLADSSTPLVKAPLEWGTGHNLATGAPVGGNPLSIIADQIPITSLGSTLIFNGEDPGTAKFPVVVHGKKYNVSERLFNWLTGSGIRDITPQRQKSELRRRQDIIQAIIDKQKAHGKGPALTPVGG